MLTQLTRVVAIIQFKIFITPISNLTVNKRFYRDRYEVCLLNILRYNYKKYVVTLTKIRKKEEK